jgi:peptidyl-Lys metalloendopeptidase
MKRIKELLTIAMLAVVLVACTTEGAAPGAESQAVPSSPTQGTPSEIELEAVLEVPATLPSGEAVNLRFTLINKTDTRLYVLQWFTPLEGLGGEIFRVKRDGQPIPYKGPLAARGDPTPDAYVFLDAGASVSATVDLAAAYDFSEAGEYTIAFISPRISHVARTEGEMAASVDDLGPVAMPSNQVSVTILEDL